MCVRFCLGLLGSVGYVCILFSGSFGYLWVGVYDFIFSYGVILVMRVLLFLCPVGFFWVGV